MKNYSYRSTPVTAGLVIGLLVLVSSSIPILYLWNRANRSLDREIRQALIDTAQSAALLVDGDLHARFTDPAQEADESYINEIAKLRRFMEANQRLAYLYTCILRDDQIHFVLDAAPPGDADGDGVDDHSYIMDVYENPSTELLNALRTMRSMADREPYTDKWGTFMSGYAPVLNRSGEPVAIVGVDLSIDEIVSSRTAIRQSAQIGLGLAIFCSLSMGVGVWLLRRRAQNASQEASAAQIARQQAETRYQHLFEQIPTGVLYFNKDLIVTDCNRRMLSISRATRENLIGMNLQSLEGNRLLPCLKDALQNRESIFVGPLSLASDDAHAWVEIRAAPVRNGDGEIAGGIATVEDITMRHRSETMSDAEKRLLGMIARAEPLDAVLFELIQTIESLIPESLCSVLLLDEEKRHLLDGASPNLPAEYTAAINGIAIGPNEGSCGTAAFLGESIVTMDIQADSRWEKYRDLAARFGLRSCWSTPIKSGKNILGTFAVYHRVPHKPGVFDRTLLERASFLAGIAIERHHFEQAISGERNLLRTLIDNLPDVIFIKDRFHKYLAANRAAVNFLGAKSEDDLIGKADTDILSAEAARATHASESAVLSGETEFNRESVSTSPDGIVTFLSTSRMPLKNTSGEIIGLVTIGRDVTDQKRVEEERIKSQKLESLGILAGGIAHDFNNILTSILGNLSFVAIAERNVSPENEELLKEAEAATLRAKELTQQLLTFAKGGLPIKKPLQVGAVIKEAATFALRGSACRLDLDLPNDLWLADIDAGQIGQVVQNLVFNADQAMPGGGTITISGHNIILDAGNEADLPPGRFISFTVTDHGTGIPEAILEKIFDPYFTTKKAGNGLGLTTTFSIIKKHGGHISVQSTPDKGSSFTFLLPALPSDEQPAARPAAAPAQTGTAHILLMDDEEAILKITSRILERAGFKVTISRHGEEALAAYRKAMESGTPVDVAVLDLTIPGAMGGRETFERLKAINPAVKAIVSSGYSVEDIMGRHEAFGFIGVVSKPYHREEFIAAINAALQAPPPA